ncbi:unnamed protein product [Rotaria magnacalcarata]|uniref:Cytidyltransferase-like domain-containing protein n=1 Tax=Rotaria magnacalcarata TaxID=392030 RepID=A0A816RWX4_9BILA|nr:unnamed protein product [Rotaria magnacalcarata]
MKRANVFNFLRTKHYSTENKKTRMHTEENTNIDIIRQNVEKGQLQDKNNNCVLIITGSLNPIHRSHIKNLHLVRNYLENHPSQPMHVVAAYLSPTHDSYVRSKLDNTHFISAKERIELCEEAIKSDGDAKDWISVAKGESQFNDFVDFDKVSIRLAQFLNNKLHRPEKFLAHPLKVVYVCGLDHFNKCSYVARLAKVENMACAVIYRCGVDDYFIRRFHDIPTLYYIPSENEHEQLVDISSTAIRETFMHHTNVDLTEFTYPCVIDFLRKMYREKGFSICPKND